MRERTVADEPIHVLVIDDDSAIVDVIRAGLEAEHMRVWGAADGAEGLDILARERIDPFDLNVRAGMRRQRRKLERSNHHA